MGRGGGQAFGGDERQVREDSGAEKLGPKQKETEEGEGREGDVVIWQTS